MRLVRKNRTICFWQDVWLGEGPLLNFLFKDISLIDSFKMVSTGSKGKVGTKMP